MPYLVGIRNSLAKQPFSITGVTHSLDSVNMNLRYMELYYAGLAPFDGIICTSHAAEQCVKKGLSRVLKRINEPAGMDSTLPVQFRQIPLGIDDAFFHQMDKAAARAYFHIPDQAVVALSVGRLSLRQKCDWSPVLETLARMYQYGAIEHFILVIAGGAEDADISLLEALISRYGLEQKVLLFPNFLSDIKPMLYQSADFYLSIIDNFQETFGINIIEAMASGLPIIASDFSGYHELVEHDKNGFLIPTTWIPELPEAISENLGILDPSLAKLYLSQTVAIDLEQLRHAIKALYQSAVLRTDMGAASLLMAQAYQWRNVIRLYENFWAELAKGARECPHTQLKTDQDILVGDFEKTFSHYPSRIVSEDDGVFITSVGRDMINQKLSVVKYQDLSVCLFEELEVFILHALMNGGQSLKTIQHDAKHHLQATHGQTLFHIGWLLKHGAIKVNKAQGSGHKTQGVR
jgi:glycosyltransferase involved in cell wall biosynthesis